MPTGFNIGPLVIRFYAIIIIIGAILGSWNASKQAKRAGRDPELILDILPWLLIGGIIGARIWHIFTPSASDIAQGVTTANYLRNPLEILKIWNGGLGIPGGVIGGALALLIWARSKKESFFEWADYIAPGLLIGQAIGRWGNFVNQEVYGSPSTLPWAITIDPANRLPGFASVATYHPLFLYESLLCAISAGILIWVSRKFKGRLFEGDIFNLYLVAYPTLRFFLEFLRLDPSPVNGINVNQTFMLVIAILAIAFFILRHTVMKERMTTRQSAIDERLAERIASENKPAVESLTVETDHAEDLPEVTGQEIAELAAAGTDLSGTSGVDEFARAEGIELAEEEPPEVPSPTIEVQPGESEQDEPTG